MNLALYKYTSWQVAGIINYRYFMIVVHMSILINYHYNYNNIYICWLKYVNYIK
jgi:hypothetical protein